MNTAGTQSVIRIALDAMGGDYSPQYEVEGAILALEELRTENVEIVLVGQEQAIRDVLGKKNADGLKISIVNADQVVEMHDDPTSVFKRKKESSLYKGVQMHANRDVAAFVSAGNTGAVMAVSSLVLGRIKGVSRPTIGAFFPTHTTDYTLVLDAGANVDSKPKHLYEFGVMGSIYTRHIRNIERPKVGLLNVGEESKKGGENISKTYEMFKQSTLNFVGNIEGRDILPGVADVVVCDGFTGNIILKLAESVVGMLKAKLRAYAAKGPLQKIATALAAPVFRRALRSMDYQEYGGVPLLGVNGVVIIGHGSSTPTALKNMVLLARDMVKKEVNSSIEMALKQTAPSQSP